MPKRGDRFRGQPPQRDLRTKFDTGVHYNRGARNYHNQNRGGRTVCFENANSQRGRGNLRNRNLKKDYRHEDDPENQWFMVTIPQGSKSSKDFLLTSLQSMCEAPFVPYNFHLDRQSVVFYVMGQDAGDALRACNRRITNENNFRITVITRRCPVPQTQLDATTINHLKEAMSRRYDGNRRYLNLTKLRHEPYLQEQGLFIPLNRPNVLIAVIRIIKENIPDIVALNVSENRLSNLEPFQTLVDNCKLLKGLDLSNNAIRQISELEYLKGLELEEIVLQRNPCASSYKDRASYISAVRSYFPKILKLDNEELSAPIGFDVGNNSVLPVSLESFFPNHSKDFVLGFIKQYFLLYDSDDRQQLIEAYHDQASFSFAINSANKNQAYFPSHMFQESRNLLKVREPVFRNRLLQKGKANIVSTLKGFPRTKHEFDSFVIDVPIWDPCLINVVINGVYRETTKKFGTQIRAFCRTFLIVPNLIINDLLFLSNATVEEIQKYANQQSTDHSGSNRMMEEQPSTSAPKDSAPNSVYINKAKIVKEFAESTGMNTSFALKCLDENSFDVGVAFAMFQELHSKGLIPHEAFQA